MTDLSPSDVLFYGYGATVIAWYRTGMQAMELGCDWVSGVGDPPKLNVHTCISRHGPKIKWRNYKIVVLQQPHSEAWAKEIVRMRDMGIRVYYEIDDYVHGVREQPDHDVFDKFTDEVLEGYENCMAVCDGIICSTQYIADQYKQYNPNVYICLNSVDGRRLSKFHLPPRSTVNFGWAGSRSHTEALYAWLPPVGEILKANKSAQFITIGRDVTDRFNTSRVKHIPGASLENFHPALLNFDVALAPAGRTSLYAGKSDLRWLEASALGIPCILDPFTYGQVEDQVTGFLADTPEAAEEAMQHMLDDPELRTAIGHNARELVLSERTIERACIQWVDIFTGAR